MAGYDNMNTGNVIPPVIQYPYNNRGINIPQYNNNYMGVQRNATTVNQNSNFFLKGRPVTSKEEALAAPIDLDGSLWIFPCLGNKKIYTKRINNDGTATFSTFTLTQDENPYNSGEFVTKDEFNKVIQTIMAAIAPQQSKEMNPAQNNNNNNNNIMDF